MTWSIPRNEDGSTDWKWFVIILGVENQSWKFHIPIVVATLPEGFLIEKSQEITKKMPKQKIKNPDKGPICLPFIPHNPAIVCNFLPKTCSLNELLHKFHLHSSLGTKASKMNLVQYLGVRQEIRSLLILHTTSRTRRYFIMIKLW